VQVIVEMSDGAFQGERWRCDNRYYEEIKDHQLLQKVLFHALIILVS